MRYTVWLAGILLAWPLYHVKPVAAHSCPECRTEIQQMLAENTLVFWASEEDGELRYTMRIDSERWDKLGPTGQDGIQALLACSISAGGEALPYFLSVRSTYSNRELARYRNGERLPLH